MTKTLEEVGYSYAGTDGSYALYDTRSGQVRVPTSTGFSFLDEALGITVPPTQSEATHARQPLFEPPAEVRAWITQKGIEDGVPEALASVAFGDMQGFLRASAKYPDMVLSPSIPVDRMWHRYMALPGHYWRACEEAGRFIDHQPTDLTLDDTQHESEAPVRTVLDPAETFSFLTQEGYEPHAEVWPMDAAAECGGRPCTNGDCTTGGPPKIPLAGIVEFDY